MSHETVPANRRVYLTLSRRADGMAMVKFSYVPPAVGEVLVALLSRGVLMNDEALVVPLVSDPSRSPDLLGPPGKAATIAVGNVASGPVGSSPQITNSGTSSVAVFDFTLPTPSDGSSAYQIARDGGYGGTQAQWLATLIGASGKSAYQLARDAGYGGTETQWLASLKAVDGVTPAISIGTVTTLSAGSQATATLTGTVASPKLNLGIPRGDPAPAPSVALGTITIGETATVAITAGTRRVVVTTPSAWGVAAGQNLLLFPVSVPSTAYATHDVIATAANTISIGLTTPAVTLLSSYSISAHLVRLNV